MRKRSRREYFYSLRWTFPVRARWLAVRSIRSIHKGRRSRELRQEAWRETKAYVQLSCPANADGKLDLAWLLVVSGSVQ